MGLEVAVFRVLQVLQAGMLFLEKTVVGGPLSPTSASQQELRVHLSGQGQGTLLEIGVFTPEK